MDSPALKRSFSNPDSNQSGGESQVVRPAKAKRSEVQAASQRHIKTEQARRDKISAGFQALQSLLPGREKVEKAMLLSQATEYITQLQGVLKLLLSSGAISKLPDDLQFQIRTLLPRKEGKPSVTVAAPPPEPQPQQHLEASQLTLPAGANLLPGMQLPFVPLLAPAALQLPELNKELPQNEGALMGQIQLLLQQQQQQAAAAQQLQTWQQTLQALQLQQVLQQQQQPAATGPLSCGLPDIMSHVEGFSGAANPLTSLAMLTSQSSIPMGVASASAAAEDPKPSGSAARRPGDCFADELPKCGLQQLMDAAACQPSATTGCRPVASPAQKARKNVKVRRHTTAARIPKPDHPNLARVGAGRPGQV